MKEAKYLAWFVIGLMLFAVTGATFKRIGDLPISTAPSVNNTWIEIDDLAASPRSARYQLSRLAVAADVSAALAAKQNASANLNQWASVGTNILANYLPLTGGTLSGALTVNDDTTINGVLTINGGAGASTFAEVTSTNGYNKDTQAGIGFTLDVANSDGTTNRLVVVGGIIVSNIPNF